MKTAFFHIFLVAGLMAPLSAGEVSEPAPAPVEESGFRSQRWYGPPYVRFGRKNSDTNLPSYAFGSMNYTHKFGANFDSLPGNVSSDQFSMYAPFLPLNREEFHLFAFANYDATKFNTNAPNLLSEDTLNTFRLPVLFFHDISENWIWGGLVMPSYGGNTSSSDGFAFSTALGAGYSFSETLQVFAGGYYFTGYGEDTLIPGIAFTWRPAPDWEVYLLPPYGGVTYSVNENWMLSLYGQYESPTWHVKADTAGPSRDINVTSLRVGLKAEYHLGSYVWGYLAGGYAIGQQLDVQTTGNTTLQQSDIDPSPYVQVGLNLRF